MALTAGGALFSIQASRALPPHPRAEFDTRLLERITRLDPEFVLLGNSMVDTRFDELRQRRPQLRARQAAVHDVIRPARGHVFH